MNFISFCDVYQNIDAAFPLNNKKKKRETERETDRQIEVPGGRHKSDRVKSNVYQDIDAAFPLSKKKKERERKKEREKERERERKRERKKEIKNKRSTLLSPQVQERKRQFPSANGLCFFLRCL